jgi:TonB family protein
MRAPLLMCWIVAAFGGPMVWGQSPATASIPSPTPQAAVNAVTLDFTPNPLVKVASTRKPLPTTGTWGVQTQIPDQELPQPCGGAESCVKVVYHVPEAGIACSWIVGFAPDSASGGVRPEIIGEDDNAAAYTMRKAFDGKDRPEIAKYVPASFPSIGKKSGISGVVTVQVIVDPGGKVVDAKVLDGPAIYRGASLEAIRQWQFKPQTVGSQTISFREDINFAFKTEEAGSVVRAFSGPQLQGGSQPLDIPCPEIGCSTTVVAH